MLIRYSVVAMFCATTTLFSQQYLGTVQGTVVDSQGNPVAEVLVNAHSTDMSANIKAVTYVKTNDAGHFLLQHLKWGSYLLITRKEKDGYPNTAFSFYSGDVEHLVTVSEAAPTIVTTIQLVPKAAVIVGTLSDELTGNSLNGGLRVWRVENQKFWIGRTVASSFEILIPSNVPTGISVQVPGYDSWNYRLSYPSGLSAGPGESIKVDVKLHKSRR